MSGAVKLLIVLYKKKSCEELVEELSDLGYEVYGPCYSDIEAYSIIDKILIDLVIMDIKLIKEKDGIELAEKIRKLNNIPIVYLTAITDDGILNITKKTAPHGYIYMPCGRNILKATVETAAERAMAQRKISVLNRILTAIKNVDMILKKSIRIDEIPQKICNKLVELKCYTSIWLIIKTQDGKEYCGISDINGDSKELREYVLETDKPECKARVMEKKQMLVLDINSCSDACHFKNLHNNSVSISLPVLYKDIIYGVMLVCLPGYCTADSEEINLLNKLSLDIGFTVFIKELEMLKKIAEKREREKQIQMEQSNHFYSLGILSTGIAHEINNPNNFIMLNAPMLKDLFNSFIPLLDQYLKGKEDTKISGIKYSDLKPEIPMLFDGIIQGSEKIKEIVLELKNFTSKESDQNFNLIDLNNIINKAVTISGNMIKKSTKNFKTKLESIPMIIGNPQKLKQLFINIIQNACQAVIDESTGILISTGTDSEKNKIIICIEDQGTGIKEEDLNFIYDPFFTTKRDKKHIGLGLTLASSIVKQHKGVLDINSKENKGTKVTITLPMSNE